MKWLKEFIDYKRLSVSAFEKSIETRSTIGKAISNNSNLRSDLLAKIIEVYEDVNTDWLLTGKGEMIKSGMITKNIVANTVEDGGISPEKVMQVIELIYLHEEELVKYPLFKVWLDNKEKKARNKGLRDYLEKKAATN